MEDDFNIKHFISQIRKNQQTSLKNREIAQANRERIALNNERIMMNKEKIDKQETKETMFKIQKLKTLLAPNINFEDSEDISS